MKLKDLENKKIVILGYGKEGKDTYLALKKLFPKKNIGIADQASNKNYLETLKNFDLIIKTPGIPLRTIKPFMAKESEIVSQTEIFFDNFPGTIIGVTGTKGKGTTASLIHHILSKNKIRVHLVGNIGKPVFQTLLKAKLSDLFVYELSSHQLQSLKKSPQIAIFLNLFPDHLDYYRNIKEYQRAKESIAIFQTKKDYFIYNNDDKVAKNLAKKTKANKIPFTQNTAKQYLSLCDISEKDIPLKGKFNLLNVMAAILAIKQFNIPIEKIREAIKTFKPLTHRLEFVGEYKGIEFYNDSMSTIPETAIKAIEALGSKVKTLIAGGSDKGSDYKELCAKILEHRIKTLIIFPGTGDKMQKEIKRIKNRKEIKIFPVKSMREAIKIAFEQTKVGETCLLSPGAASFNLFRDYKDRGNLFKKYAKLYGNNKKQNTS